MILTHAALLALAVQCISPPSVPMVVGLIEGVENANRVTTLVNKNPNGTRDYGLGQINDSNFPTLTRLLRKPINARTILDPCTNLRAAEAVLLLRYNGRPPPEVGAIYVSKVLGKINDDVTQQSRTFPIPPIPSNPISRPGRTRGDLVVAQRTRQ